MMQRFKYLAQPKYKGDHGQELDASLVDVLTPYKFIADGFHHWECGICHCEHFDRSCGWPISGQVLACKSCSKMNLLVRTNCVELDALMTRNFAAEYDKQELERLRGIEKYNAGKIEEIRRKLVQAVQNTSVNVPAEAQSAGGAKE